MGCRGPGADAMIPRMVQLLVLLVFSVALDCKTGEETRDAWKGVLQY